MRTTRRWSFSWEYWWRYFQSLFGGDHNTPHIPYVDYKNRSAAGGRDSIAIVVVSLWKLVQNQNDSDQLLWYSCPLMLSDHKQPGPIQSLHAKQCTPSHVPTKPKLSRGCPTSTDDKCDVQQKPSITQKHVTRPVVKGTNVLPLWLFYFFKTPNQENWNNNLPA
jgi:hypothetical protein